MSTRCITLGSDVARHDAQRGRRRTPWRPARTRARAASASRRAAGGTASAQPVRPRITQSRKQRRSARSTPVSNSSGLLVEEDLHHQHAGGDQQHVGHRGERGVEVLDHLVDPAAEVARQDAEHHREAAASRAWPACRSRRRAHALQRLVEHVVAGAVGAEHVVVAHQRDHGAGRSGTPPSRSPAPRAAAGRCGRQRCRAAPGRGRHARGASAPPWPARSAPRRPGRRARRRARAAPRRPPTATPGPPGARRRASAAGSRASSWPSRSIGSLFRPR